MHIIFYVIDGSALYRFVSVCKLFGVTACAWVNVCECECWVCVCANIQDTISIFVPKHRIKHPFIHDQS